MPALTQVQWFNKIKSLIPSWVFENEHANVAITMGIAKVLNTAQANIDSLINETYIDSSSETYAEWHGEERSIIRLDSEQLSQYKQRIKKIVNKTNLFDIKKIVDALLIRGEAIVMDNKASSGAFMDRNAYLDRNIIDFEVIYNAFTIIIDYQKPLATSFFDRGTFFDRKSVYGSAKSLEEIFRNIVYAVNANKAYGTVYRLIERANI